MELFERGFSWTFYNGVQLSLLAPDGVLDTEMINLLFRNAHDTGRFRGCFRAYLPLEKFTSEEMSQYKKLMPLAATKRIVGAIAEHRVPQLNLGFIIGSPAETRQSLRVVKQIAREFQQVIIDRSGGGSSPVCMPWCSLPIPGTPDYSRYRQHIKFGDLEFPELYSNYISVIGNGEFAPHEFALARKAIESSLNAGIR